MALALEREPVDGPTQEHDDQDHLGDRLAMVSMSNSACELCDGGHMVTPRRNVLRHSCFPKYAEGEAASRTYLI